ncbi:MAG: DUF1003 domain-containing protein [Sphingomonadales bacterium]|nr:DUF1003 domain-containing protein [Sphingomonadales bacterium]PIX65129.1 MAG: hypothetical protein COZ43_10210 [Sphingomonadales bacterium CG_4_10_14_3_um_filter_58_15]NCO47638.1 DUF1003 domain-containing protein [Sphingomonadales bacterium]NCP00336.1 DUF1003 domain-containing protein [Sphingomonadales bacterium]NCP26828.1 DUF1003 domain-containing protein [Sphingomonadales bacterium]
MKRTVEQLSEQLLHKPVGALSPEERGVLEAIVSRQIVSDDAGELADERASFGERLSDQVAAVGGSWGFIIAFAIVLFGWMLLNSEVLTRFDAAFDPYPFIFLNLLLSTLAAIQAPIIMMSQNRASNKDRIAAAHDYEVNLRAEIDIIRLHEKLDLLMLEKVTKLEADLGEIKAALRTA